jgi:hypothetical protein
MDGLLSGTQVYATPSVVLSTDFQQSGDYERIRKQLEVIKQIQAAAFGNYLSPSDTPLVNNTLPHRLQYAGKKLQESADPVQPGFLAGVNELLGYLSANSGDTERTRNRSHLYKVICELDRSGQYTAELKELVDLCYNEVVAASLCDNEKDIMSVKRFLNRELLQIFYRNGINVPFPNITFSALDTNGRKTIEDLMKQDNEKKEKKDKKEKDEKNKKKGD